MQTDNFEYLDKLSQKIGQSLNSYEKNMRVEVAEPTNIATKVAINKTRSDDKYVKKSSLTVKKVSTVNTVAAGSPKNSESPKEQQQQQQQ